VENTEVWFILLKSPHIAHTRKYGSLSSECYIHSTLYWISQQPIHFILKSSVHIYRVYYKCWFVFGNSVSETQSVRPARLQQSTAVTSCHVLQRHGIPQQRYQISAKTSSGICISAYIFSFVLWQHTSIITLLSWTELLASSGSRYTNQYILYDWIICLAPYSYRYKPHLMPERRHYSIRDR
jgi:hypothetical protein